MRPHDPFGLDYFALLKEAKTLEAAPGSRRLRLALLADCSTQHLVPLLKALFGRAGVAVEVYEAPFGAAAQEAFSPQSGLYAFQPQIAVILNDPRALRDAFQRFSGTGDEFAEKTAASMEQVWTAIQGRCGATVIQANLAVPYETLFGQFDEKAGLSFSAAVRSLNRRLTAGVRANARLLLLDLERVSSYLGLRRWFDEKLWVLSKSPCSFDCLPHLAQAIVAAARPVLGGVVKCVVVDLDDTLWGGTVGDDGLEGLRIGHVGDGEAFSRFQQFLKGLKDRGILLAICSRNDAETALEALRRHPEMVLKESDFSAIAINWSSKDENVREIAGTLSIGLDSMVFLDDDAFQRNLIRAKLPEVIVPELPEDAADYVKTLCEVDLFGAASFSAEDKQRARMYQQQARREALKSRFESPEDYLRSLNMRITLSRFDTFHIPRIAQLMGRSNQFNLTTKRYSEAECERFMNDRDNYPFYVKLEDDLGDNGLIAVAILQPKEDAVEIDEWLMSCRVLMRGVEDYMMNRAFRFAAEKDARRVVGRYLPTAKNGMVKDFFARYGFEKSGDLPGGGSTWSLEVSRYQRRPVFFREERTEAVND